MKKSISKARFAKKAGAVVLSCVLLCGQGMSVAAASSAAIQRKPVHEHAFSVLEWNLIGYAPYKHHDYIKDGNTQSCAIWMYVYSGEAVCACGESIGLKSKSEYVHLNCGQ